MKVPENDDPRLDAEKHNRRRLAILTVFYTGVILTVIGYYLPNWWNAIVLFVYAWVVGDYAINFLSRTDHELSFVNAYALRFVSIIFATIAAEIGSYVLLEVLHVPTILLSDRNLAYNILVSLTAAILVYVDLMLERKPDKNKDAEHGN